MLILLENINIFLSLFLPVDDSLFYVYKPQEKKYTFWRCVNVAEDGLIEAQAMNCYPYKQGNYQMSEVGVYKFRGQNEVIRRRLRENEISGKAILVMDTMVSVPNGTINEIM